MKLERDKRTERIAVHLTPKERFELKRLARDAGYASIARYMREVSLRLSLVGICARCAEPKRLTIIREQPV